MRNPGLTKVDQRNHSQDNLRQRTSFSRFAYVRRSEVEKCQRA